MNFINGKFYEIYLNLGIPENGYIIEYSEVESEMILNIREEVAQYIQDPSEILTVEATFDTEPVSGEMVFEADVSFQTPYGIQAKHISGIVELS